jgi:hypothetical protein
VESSGNARPPRKKLIPKRSTRGSRQAVVEITKPEIDPSVLTPELTQFIDRVIVPILLREYLADGVKVEKRIAKTKPTVASFTPMIEPTDSKVAE